MSAADLAPMLGLWEEGIAALVQEGMPHYNIAGHQRFDAIEIEQWIGWNTGWRRMALGRVANPAVPRRPGFVYFIGTTNDADPIKVGWAVDPARRREALQSGHWQRLEIHGTLPGTLTDEGAAHTALREHRVLNEWFAREPALSYLRDYVSPKKPRARRNAYLSEAA